MAKHSKNKTSTGTLVLGLVMAVAVIAGLISIISGKTVNSDNAALQPQTVQEQPAGKTEEPAKPESKPETTAQTEAPAASGKTEEPEAPETPAVSDEPIVNENGDKISFGQIPQSTENADPNEPDVTVTQAPAASSSGEITTTDTVTDDWLILANKTHHLSQDYWPDDMVTVSSCIEGVGNNDTRKMRKIAADALEELIKGAAEAGYQIKMRTGFRSYDYQKSLFASYVQKNGEEAANKFSAKAGESEHQTGLCCDVSSPSVGWAISYEYGKTAEGKWLSEHCHEYGFIVRYLEGKEDITGYNYEPWHIRYVGVDVATEIFNKGICFEEYLETAN